MLIALITVICKRVSHYAQSGNSDTKNCELLYSQRMHTPT